MLFQSNEQLKSNLEEQERASEKVLGEIKKATGELRNARRAMVPNSELQRDWLATMVVGGRPVQICVKCNSYHMLYDWFGTKTTAQWG